MPTQQRSSSHLPLGLKLAFTAFMAVMVPAYAATYGFANFLYFCDIAMFVTLVALWREDSLLVSMAAVGILAPQALWVVDFAAHFAGFSLTGMTDYMFDADKSLFLRGLSLFHGWLPLLLVWLVARLGYDRRALAAWTAVSTTTLLICWLFMPCPTPNPGNAAVNINYVWGLSETAAQAWVHPLAWLGGLIVGLPLLLFWPTHWALRRWAKACPTGPYCAP